MGQATSKGNETKSKMKQPSDMPTPRFKKTVVAICGQKPQRRPDKSHIFERMRGFTKEISRQAGSCSPIL